MTNIPKKMKFNVKAVTIKISPRHEIEGDFFDIQRVKPITSPLEYTCGTATETAEIIRQWLENTINAMKINEAKSITIKFTWQ